MIDTYINPHVAYLFLIMNKNENKPQQAEGLRSKLASDFPPLGSHFDIPTSSMKARLRQLASSTGTYQVHTYTPHMNWPASE